MAVDTKVVIDDRASGHRRAVAGRRVPRRKSLHNLRRCPPAPVCPGSIYRIDPATFEYTDYTDALLGHPLDLAADASGNLYAIDSTTPRIVKYTAAGGTWSVWKTGLTSPQEIAVSGDGHIYVRDGQSILKFDLAGNPATPWSPAVTEPSGLAADSSGCVYVCDAATHVVKRLSPDGSLEASWGGANGFGEFHATGLAVPPDGSAIYGAEAPGGAFAIRNSFTYRGVFDSAETEVTVTAINGADPAQFTGFDPEARDAITAGVTYTVEDGTRIGFDADLREAVGEENSTRFQALWTVGYSIHEDESQVQWSASCSNSDESPEPGIYRPATVQVVGLPQADGYSIQAGTVLLGLEQHRDACYMKAASVDYVLVLPAESQDRITVLFYDTNMNHISTTVRFLRDTLDYGLKVSQTQAELARMRKTIIRNTDWLVTHDPAFEGSFCQDLAEEGFEQAQLMSNKAIVRFRVADPNTVPGIHPELWKSSKICDGHYAGVSDGLAVFEFRTTEGSDTQGAKTDPSGGIYVEGHPLTPGKYEIRVEPLVTPYKWPIVIGPLFTFDNSSNVPNVLASPPDKVDPYGPTRRTGLLGVLPRSSFYRGCGMELSAVCKDKAIGQYQVPGGDELAAMYVENNQQGSPVGDLTGGHYLRTPEEHIPAGKRTFKWEGFNDVFDLKVPMGEVAFSVFMRGLEAEYPIDPPWWPQPQAYRGYSPECTVAPGDYILTIGLRRAKDQNQMHTYRIPICVEYKEDN